MTIKIAWIIVLIAVLSLAGPAAPRTEADTQPENPTNSVVVRLFYRDQAQLNAVAGRLDIWEAHQDDAYVLAAVRPEQYQWLQSLGYGLEIDAEKTELLGQRASLDPRFHYFDSYYPNSLGLYIVGFMQENNTAYPTLTELYDAGDAWLATQPGEHARDMWVLRVTNEDSTYGPIESKPAFFLLATIHAREVATPELTMRYISYLTEGWNDEGGYGVDADVTWLVNHVVLYVLVMQNPDGHWVDEQDMGAYRRKNLNSADGCGDPASWGVDLNRNHSFLWGCCGGSSGDPCDETYRGSDRGSEPETQAFQEFFATVISDQNGPNDDFTIAPASPITTTGLFLSLHSYSDVVLWPWFLSGYPQPPNLEQLETIGRKFSYYNGYQPSGSIGYMVDGSSDIWTYGKFGVASFTFEVGPGGGSCGGFFPAYGCIDGTDGMPRNFWAENKPAFLYAHKIARAPYMTAYGPDAEEVTVMPGVVAPGTPVQLSATVADHRYPGDPLQPVAAAEFFIGSPGEDGTGLPMAPADGSWGGFSEQVAALVDTSALPVGQTYFLVHGRNSLGDWGPFSAVFLYVMEPGVSPVIQGYVRDAENNAPLGATVTAGTFQDQTDPATGFYSMLVISGTYDVTAEAPGYIPASVPDVVAHNYQVVEQDFYLYPFCDLFVDDVESGNNGWTADAPWAITDEAFHSPSHSWTDSPGGPYQNNINISLTSPPFDLRDHNGISLSFWHIYDIQYFWDYGYVQYSTDGGATWAQAAAYSNDQQLTWTQESLPVPALDDQPDARIRFRLTTTPYVQQDGWHIDDIVLSGSGPSCVTPLAPIAAFASNSPVQLGEAMLFTNQTLGTPPLTYAWDFGDGLGTSTEVNPEYTYQEAGTYNVTLIATNDLGTDSVSHPVSVLEPTNVMHIRGIKLRDQDRGNGRFVVFGTVRIVDQNNQPTEGAKVSTEWTLPDGSRHDQQAVTSARGLAQFRLRSQQTGIHQLCVTDVAKAGWYYDPDQNVETCHTLTVP